VGTRLLAPSGITLAQYNVLRILRGAEPEGLPTLAVRKRLITAAPAITRLIDRLEHAGLAVRVAVPGDRRQRLCRITPGGLALLERLDPVIVALDDLAAEVLSDKELGQLTELLDRIRKRIVQSHC
jgi:DNA-binding MarR family transcriptional regulator